MNLTPKEIVKELDKYIIGQDQAKRSVAIALRNRYRRQMVSSPLREEIYPKNILMIGPTGVGKTEIARRLAALSKSPFLKVEVTKFTEVGYVGRDVESMIRDIMSVAVRMVKKEMREKHKKEIDLLVEERLLSLLLPGSNSYINTGNLKWVNDDFESEIEVNRESRTREKLRRLLRKGKLEQREVEVEVKENTFPTIEIFSNSGVEEMGVNFQSILGSMFPSKSKRKKVKIKDARKILAQEEEVRVFDMDEVVKEAIRRVETSGIIFLDEIDKIASTGGSSHGPEVSREGVQRDILPIVEGSTVSTKYGPVKTDHILFIAAGAFHTAKPSQLIPELQGRFPIRVNLDSLTKKDLKRILVEPEASLVKQYTALLAAEGMELIFEDSGIDEIAEFAVRVNEEVENIGARRLATIMEKILEEALFLAPEIPDKKVIVDKKFVDEKMEFISKNKELTKYVL